MSDHECLYPEEQEPSGRLILGPCLECNRPALEGLALAQAELEWVEAAYMQLADACEAAR